MWVLSRRGIKLIKGNCLDNCSCHRHNTYMHNRWISDTLDGVTDSSGAGTPVWSGTLILGSYSNTRPYFWPSNRQVSRQRAFSIIRTQMLRRILRFLPHSSQTSNKFSAVFRQRTIVVPRPHPLRPWLFVCLGVSVATFATITTIHADATQESDDDKRTKNQAIRSRIATTAPIEIKLEQILESFNQYLLPKKTPPSPTTDEIFDLSSESDDLGEKSIGIIRVDTILLARYVHEQCSIYFVYFSYFSQIIATNPAKTSFVNK